jgi:hypothetical protein
MRIEVRKMLWIMMVALLMEGDVVLMQNAAEKRWRVRW